MTETSSFINWFPKLYIFLLSVLIRKRNNKTKCYETIRIIKLLFMELYKG